MKTLFRPKLNSAVRPVLALVLPAWAALYFFVFQDVFSVVGAAVVLAGLFLAYLSGHLAGRRKHFADFVWLRAYLNNSVLSPGVRVGVNPIRAAMLRMYHLQFLLYVHEDKEEELEELIEEFRVFMGLRRPA